ncbi:MAG: chloride channel protein [Oscillospiraceae bacterium]|jgi:H+/Cl- antiporter ClcA|nr:chloride channel protein [Oscillospiraceae bacterium]
MSVRESLKQIVAETADVISGNFSQRKEWTHHLGEFVSCQWKNPRDMVLNLKAFLKWTFLSMLIGAVAGGAGTLFYFCIRYATELRFAHEWLIWLLPLGGLVIVFLYHLGKITQPKGTNLIIEAVRSPEPIPTVMAPLIFIATGITHLLGGSAGREGAALQLGGSLGYRIGKMFHLDEKDLHVVTMCGMAACFSALFGTPLTSTLLVMEVITVGVMYYSALVPCVVASIVAAGIAQSFHAIPTQYPVTGEPAIGILPLMQVALLGILCALVSILYCFVMQGTGLLYKKWIPNQYVRVVVGGVLIIVLAMIFGRDYLGMGGEMISAAFHQSAPPEAFLLKLIFTAVTLGAGFRGGEIVPAFFVGATFGSFVGSLIGLDPSFAASIGFMSVFCGVTNCPLTAFVLSVEVFSEKGILYYLLAAGISYMLSGYCSLYSQQKILYAKDKCLYIGGE